MTDTKKSNLYTRTGDSGTTSLVGGERVAKDSTRLEAYGTVDELNSHIGLLIAYLPQSVGFDDVRSILLKVQNKLFDIGAALATPESDHQRYSIIGVGEADVVQIESEIDRVDSQLPKLKCFVLPGGTIAASQAHVARTVCRRAERRVITLTSEAPVSPIIVRYLNRLSDLLFAIARLCNHLTSTPDLPWHP